MLRFLSLACLVQVLLCREFIVENPTPSDIWNASPLSELIDNNIARKHNLDQCMYGSMNGPLPSRKATTLLSNLALEPFMRTCDGCHQHAPLKGGASTARSAVYPLELCEQLVLMSKCCSGDPAGGSIAFAGQPQGHHFADLSHAFTDLRAIAAARGLASTWDRLSRPWFLLAFGEAGLDHAANAEVQRTRSCSIARHNVSHLCSYAQPCASHIAQGRSTTTPPGLTNGGDTEDSREHSSGAAADADGLVSKLCPGNAS